MAESLNATFFAFRKREQGGVLLRATLAYVIVAIALAGGFMALNWQAAIDYLAWVVTLSERAASVDPNNPYAMMPPASVMQIIPMYMLFSFVFYILFAAYETACLRWMIHGEVRGFMGLSLGADTWRTWFSYWLWLFIFIAVYIVFFIVMFMAMGGAFMAGASGDAASGVGAGLIGLVLVLALLFGWLYLAVRLAPASATSVAARRFSFFDAWKVTTGRFWPLLGSFALLFVMFVVGATVLYGVMSVAVLGGIFSQVQSTGGPESTQQALALLASPSVWIPLAVAYAVMIVGSFIFYVALFGINARAAALALQEGKLTAASQT